MNTIIEPFRIKMVEPLRGLKILEAPPTLRHFTAKFAEL